MPARPAVASTTRAAAKTKRKEYDVIPARPVADDPAKYSKTPHEFGDCLIMHGKLGGELQFKLVYWIERQTFGANIGTAKNVKRPEWAKLSLGQLARMCGPKTERKSVARAIADLVKRGIIAERDRQGCGSTTAKMYKLEVGNWKTAPAYEPPAVCEDDEEEDPEEFELAEDIPAADEAPEAVVQPGKVSRPQVVVVQTSKDAPPIHLRVVYRCEAEFPLTFRARCGKNGRIQVTAAEVKKGETKANRCSPAGLQLTKSRAANKQLSDLESFISVFVENWFKKPADAQLMAAIAEKLGDCPVSLYRQTVEAKFSARGGGKHTSGLLIRLAEDARKVHQSEIARQTRQAAPPVSPALTLPHLPPDPPAAPQPPPDCVFCRDTGKVSGEKCGACLGRKKKAVKQ